MSKMASPIRSNFSHLFLSLGGVICLLKNQPLLLLLFLQWETKFCTVFGGKWARLNAYVYYINIFELNRLDLTEKRNGLDVPERWDLHHLHTSYPIEDDAASNKAKAQYWKYDPSHGLWTPGKAFFQHIANVLTNWSDWPNELCLGYFW